MKIDSSNAPKGYKAVAPVNTKNYCKGCAFAIPKTLGCGMDRPCTPCERQDKQIVIFVKK